MCVCAVERESAKAMTEILMTAKDVCVTIFVKTKNSATSTMT